ncbi:hypothetical protein P692DRAFT_201724211, partial [Suillus brevipes Sb2]
VAEVLRQVKIGDDLTGEQRTQVRELCAEFADTFALAVSEVYPVDLRHSNPPFRRERRSTPKSTNDL